MELHEHDIEQLEEVLEPVEDPDLLNTNLVSASSDTPPIMRPFVNSIFPVLLINKEFLILFANRACNNLFTGYFRLQNNLF